MRFPTYPKDILDRADALLSEKYPDGIVDPRFVEIACEAMMMERGRSAALCRKSGEFRGELGNPNGADACFDLAIAIDEGRQP